MEILQYHLRTPPYYCTTSLQSKRVERRRTTKHKHLRRHQPPPIRPLTQRDGGSSTTSRNRFFYPKSSPNPLLIDQTPTIQTRDQVLDNVLRDLEASIEQGIIIEPTIFSSLLETCFQTDHFNHGIRVHRLIPQYLLRNSADLSSKLLRLYSACSLMEEAHQIFDQMPQRIRKKTAFAWNSLISGYSELGLFEDAMALYYQMEEDGVKPDRFTFPRVLKACAGLGSVAIGEAVHRHAVRSGLSTDPFVLNALVDMYAKCGDILKARRIFNMITQCDPVSWNSMLTAYAHHGLYSEALSVCRKMLQSGLEPDSVAISKVLSGISTSRIGVEIHGWTIRRCLEKNLSVANALISMYSDCGRLSHAWMVFELMPEKDVISWNAVIYAHRRCPKALKIFQLMEHSGVLPDQVTFVSLLSACANLGMVEDGRELFAKMEEKYRIKAGMEHYSCMVNLLGRAGLVNEAYKLVSNRMPFDGGPTVWGALLFACSLHGNVSVGEIAAERLFELEPDNAHNFELMMKIYERTGRSDDLEKVRRMMSDRGLES